MFVHVCYDCVVHFASDNQWPTVSEEVKWILQIMLVRWYFGTTINYIFISNKNLWTSESGNTSPTSSLKIHHMITYQSWFPFAASTLLGSLPTKSNFWTWLWEFPHFITKALSLATAVGSVKAFHLIPKMFTGVEVRAQCRPIELFHTNFGKLCLYEAHFVYSCTVIFEHVWIPWYPKY